MLLFHVHFLKHPKFQDLAFKSVGAASSRDNWAVIARSEATRQSRPLLLYSLLWKRTIASKRAIGHLIPTALKQINFRFVVA
jgi:hypothetical protein